MTEFEDRLDAALADGAGETKRGRGRPRKADEQQPVEIDFKVIGQALQIPFDLWSVGQGVPELKITTAESILMAKPVKQLLDHYIPSLPEIAWAWISLGAVSYSIMKCRLELLAEIRKNKDSSSEQTTGDRVGTNRRGKGVPSSFAFPTIENIINPVT